MKLKIVVLTGLLLSCALMVGAQATPSPAPAGTSVATMFALTASAIALPGNHQTVSGSISGLMISPTDKLDFREDNLVPSTAGQLGFFGGFNYHFPAISTKINNASTTMNGYNFDIYLTASLGTTRITDPNGTTNSHYAGLAGMGMNYKLFGSNTWQLGIEARAARLPGMAAGWTAIISVGPSIHF